jgi:protein-tyrosine phosphatase
MENGMIRVMFVCMGNICRSPMAEAVFLHLVDQAGFLERIEVSSSGTNAYHVGEKPHVGTRAVLKKNGIPLNPVKRANQFSRQDLKDFDYILAADSTNVAAMPESDKIRRLLELYPDAGLMDVPDPYYEDNFDYVYDLITAACKNLLKYIVEAEGF